MPEPLVSLRPSPGRIDLRLPNLNALFDRSSPPDFPHTGPAVEKSIASYLVGAARGQRWHSAIEVAIALDSGSPSSQAEADARTQLNHYFANEAELTSLELRVNREEGLGALRYSIPLVALALVVAGVFYAQLGKTTGEGYLASLTYLVFITIVWVMLWDPLELLLFNPYIIRSRVRALRKLASAPVSFSYGPAVFA